MKRSNKELRQYPKLKLFVNGFYVYNPIINEVSLRNLRDLIGHYTKYLYDNDLVEVGGLGIVIKQRAIAARYLSVDRRRFIQHKKGIK